MKNKLKIFMPLMVLVLFASCASTSGVVNETKASNKVNTSASGKLQYEDWKYRGFGIEVPDWVDFAVSGNIKKYAEQTVELKDKEINVVMENGINSDHSENKLKLAVQDESFAEYTLYDSFWIKMNDNSDMPYCSLALYYR